QKRRVAELLANAIPEDEALLLRNGRFACSVCPHRPVCDTLETLVVHRAGRKHLDSEWVWPGWAWSQLVCPPCGRGLTAHPRPQAPLLARTRRIARSALLKSAPYSSRCRRAGSGKWGKWEKSLRIPQKIPSQKSQKKSPKSPGIFFKIPNPSKIAFCSSGVPREESQRNSQISEERLQILRQHLHLRSRGWIQDRSGNWVKDENAEFDSDEEEPPPL
ncbi:SCNM1 protein, partial [Pardalotus punctatus]|nr:SCNM1 protein [Pardalotus punctatus]